MILHTICKGVGNDYLEPVFALPDEIADIEGIGRADALADISAVQPKRRRFADTAEFNEYIASVTAFSIHTLPADVHYGDRLLTLVTCSEAYDGGRLVIVCRELQ